MRFCFNDQQGQTTIEAAVIIPVLFLLFSLAFEPIVLLYNRCVMQSAAAEACRYVSTIDDIDSIEMATKRHLGAIPNIPIFHLKNQDGWNVQVDRSDNANVVRISHKLLLLPFTQLTAGLIASTVSGATAQQDVIAQATVEPSWLQKLDSNPEEWIDQWE